MTETNKQRQRNAKIIQKWTEKERTLLFGEIKHLLLKELSLLKKHPKIPGNELFDAILKSCFRLVTG